MTLLVKRWEDTRDLASDTMKTRYWESCEMYPINWSVRKPFLLPFTGEEIASVVRKLFLLNARAIFKFSSHDSFPFAQASG